jgi:NDP-sugar pyrophosphorylase family protein
MFPGLHVLEPAIFGHMASGEPASITRTTYPALLAQGLSIAGYVTAARWINIDTPASLAAADRELRGSPLGRPT